MLIVILISFVSIAFGQTPGVMLDVKPVNRKEKLVYSRSLAVTVRSTSGVPINEAQVRWAVIKEAYDLNIPEKTKKNAGQTANVKVHSTGPPQAFGGEKTIDLAPLQSFSFETDAIKSYEGRFHNDPPMPGDSIIGHGVRVILNGKVIAESYSDPRHKDLFEKIQPPEAATPAGQKPAKKKK